MKSIYAAFNIISLLFWKNRKIYIPAAAAAGVCLCVGHNVGSCSRRLFSDMSSALIPSTQYTVFNTYTDMDTYPHMQTYTEAGIVECNNIISCARIHFPCFLQIQLHEKKTTTTTKSFMRKNCLNIQQQLV